MNRSARLKAATLAAVAVAGLSVQTASAKPAEEPQVPSKIAVPEGNKPFLARHAVGVQIYSCNGAGSWGLVAPRADLFDDKGKHRGTHSGGPTWQDQDGSTVVASRVDGVTVDPTAIPWLLLKATPTAPGKLGKTTYIQRIATEGGLAPAASTCTAENAGQIVEVPYEADYVFWKAG